MKSSFNLSVALALLSLGFGVPCLGQKPAELKTRSMNVLFVGNSYTARHNLVGVVKAMAEAGDEELAFNPTQVIYGGRTLKDHWRLGTQHIVNQHIVAIDQVNETVAVLQSAKKSDPQYKYAAAGLKRMKTLAEQIAGGTVDRGKWDLVVLQSYRDDLNGEQSAYMQFAPRFAKLAKSQGARVLLYETTPTTQNQFPIAQHQDATPVIEKSKQIAALADSTGSLVAPMAFIGLKCQIGNPETTLRFENDAHLNQTMAYLTACTIYAAIFDRSPEGLPIDSITDIRYWNNDRETGKDRDGDPIKKVFTDQERRFLQSTAWKGLNEFKATFQKR